MKAVEYAKAMHEVYRKAPSTIAQEIEVLDHNNYTINEMFYLFDHLTHTIKSYAKRRTYLLQKLKVHLEVIKNSRDPEDDIVLRNYLVDLDRLDKNSERHLKSFVVVCKSMSDLISEEEKIEETRINMPEE